MFVRFLDWCVSLFSLLIENMDCLSSLITLNDEERENLIVKCFDCILSDDEPIADIFGDLGDGRRFLRVILSIEYSAFGATGLNLVDNECLPAAVDAYVLKYYSDNFGASLAVTPLARGAVVKVGALLLGLFFNYVSWTSYESAGLTESDVEAVRTFISEIVAPQVELSRELEDLLTGGQQQLPSTTNKQDILLNSVTLSGVYSVENCGQTVSSTSTPLTLQAGHAAGAIDWEAECIKALRAKMQLESQLHLERRKAKQLRTRLDYVTKDRSKVKSALIKSQEMLIDTARRKFVGEEEPSNEPNGLQMVARSAGTSSSRGHGYIRRLKSSRRDDGDKANEASGSSALDALATVVARPSPGSSSRRHESRPLQQQEQEQERGKAASAASSSRLLLPSKKLERLARQVPPNMFCDWCKVLVKSLQTENDMYAHYTKYCTSRRLHLGRGFFECEQCKLGFLDTEALKEHSHVHDSVITMSQGNWCSQGDSRRVDLDRNESRESVGQHEKEKKQKRAQIEVIELGSSEDGSECSRPSKRQKTR